MNVEHPPTTKRQRTQSASQQPMHEATVAADPPHHLAAISELEEMYDSPVVTQDSAINYDSAGPSIYEDDGAPNYSPEFLENTKDFFRTLGATDRYGSEESEDFDLNVSGIDGEDEDGDEDEDGSGDENDISDLSMEALRARFPQAAVGKHTKPKAIKQQPKNVSCQSDNKAHANYDPDTCCKYFLYLTLMWS